MAVDYGALARRSGGVDLDSLAASMGGAAVGDTANQPVAQAPMGGAAFSGVDQPLEEPGAFGLMDPLNWLPYGKIGEAGLALGRAGLGALGRVGPAVAQGAGGALARGAGGAALEAGMEFLPPWLRIPARGAMAMARGAVKEAPQAAPEASGAAQAVSKELGIPLEQAAEQIGKPLLGHEAQLFRTGGMPAVVRERLASAAEAATPAAAPAAAPIAEAAPAVPQVPRVASGLSDAEREALKAASDTLRRRAFATLTALGEKTDAEALGKIVGRKITSRTELTTAEWNQIVRHGDDLLAQKLANERIAAKLAKGAAKGAAKAKPAPAPEAAAQPAAEVAVPKKVRGASPRGHSTSGPTFVPPGQLGGQLQASLALEREMAARGITDPADKAVIYAQARRLGIVP